MHFWQKLNFETFEKEKNKKIDLKAQFLTHNPKHDPRRLLGKKE